MIAVDTNLLARLLLQDDAVQHAKVKALFKTQKTFTAPTTVLLELVWVLESKGCTPTQIVQALTLLLGLPNFKPDQEAAVREALQGYAKGMGFADALHLSLSLSSGHDLFMTFDKAFARQATKLGKWPEVAMV
jgi:predicted nucleic-acid-binding protein